MEDKEFFQWLESLIHSLQLSRWSLEEKINRQQAITLIANFFNLDPEDPQLPQKALLELQKISAEEKPTPSIPPNLKEIVEEYENFLASQEKELKKIPSYWEYYQKISEEILKQLKNPWLAKTVGIQITKQTATELPAVTHPQAFIETFSPEEYQATLQRSIEENLPLGIQLPPKKIKNLREKTQSLAAFLAATPRPEIISPLPPTPEEYNLVRTKLAQAVSSFPPETQKFTKEVVSWTEKEVKNKIIEGKTISPQEYSQIISRAVTETSKTQKIPPKVSSQTEKMLNDVYPQIKEVMDKTSTILEGISDTFKTLPESKNLPPETKENLKEQITQKFAPLLLTYTIPPSPQIEKNASQIFKDIGLAHPPESIKIVGEKIEKNIIETLAIKKEPQGVVFKPIFILLHPPTAISAIKKIALAPIVKPLQWMVKIAPENVPEEIKKFVLEGLNSKDVQESIKTLQESGFPPQHPKVDKLKSQQDKLSSFESSHKLLSFILRHYHEFSKKTGSRQIQESKTGLWLPRLSPPPVWQKQKGYVWILREGLNRLGIFLKTHRWLPSPSGKIIRFVLPDKIIRLFTFGKIKSFTTLKRFTYQKIIQPVLIWLGKTAIGKAIKTGVKKVVSWGLAKIGISLAGAVAGAAAGPPGWVVTLVSFLPNIVSWVKRGIKKLLKKPELAILLGIGLVGLPILVPMLPVLGFIFTTAGIISVGIGFLAKGGSLLAGIAGKIGGFLSSAASTINGFLSSLSTISLPSILPTIAVGGSVGTIAIATTFTIITTGSTFIQEGKGIGEQPPHIGEPVNPRPPSETNHLAEIVIWTLNECGITAVNKNTWEKTESCLKNTNIQNKEVIIDRFRYSVFFVGPGLQCVGFVRGITAALGKELAGGRYKAREYLNPPTPPGYYPIEKDMNKVNIGDLVITEGKTDGHIAIVVNQKDDYIWVAQAWGTSNGILQITQIKPIYFDGFLRAK